MIGIFLERLKQGYRTSAYPNVAPALPDRYQGLPVIDQQKCDNGCRECAEACPTDAIVPAAHGGEVRLDLGKCLFCSECREACPSGAVTFSSDYRMAVRSRDDLLVGKRPYELARSLDDRMKRLFGRSLKLRQVSAGGCNGCEADVNVLNTLVFDLGRFGLKIVASPRHADGLLITGPVTDNMKLALEKTYAATAAPKIVIAVGACAISGGPYIGHQLAHNGADSVVPVDLYIPGCPPNPWTILDGLLRLMGRLESGERAAPAAVASK